MPALFLPNATYRFDPDGRAFMNGHIYPYFSRKEGERVERNHAAEIPALEGFLKFYGVDGSASVAEQAEAIISIALLVAFNRTANPTPSTA